MFSCLLLTILQNTDSHTACLASAQTAKFCPPESNSVCYSVNVPANTASSGTGDLFFQIQGPSSHQWMGLGQGGQMTGANIFIIYADSTGKNVTLSPRLGKGNFQPQMDNDAKVSLLDGTGIVNGVMTANVRCTASFISAGASGKIPNSVIRLKLQLMEWRKHGSEIVIDQLDLVCERWVGLEHQRPSRQPPDPLRARRIQVGSHQSCGRKLRQPVPRRDRHVDRGGRYRAHGRRLGRQQRTERQQHFRS